MNVVGQLVFDGLAMGLVYVIVAVGMVLIMSTSKILFMAYGSFYTLGAYLTWLAVSPLKLPFTIAVLLSAIMAGILGALSYVLIFRRLQLKGLGGSKFLATLIGSLGLMLVLNQAVLLLFGTVPRNIKDVLPGAWKIWGVSLSLSKLVLIGVGIVVTIILFWVVMKSKGGRALRTAAFSPDVAVMHGISPMRMYAIVLGLACGVAGLAGGLLAPTYGISPNMGDNVIWTVLLMVYVGGMDSLFGAVIGGVVIGQLLSFGQYFIGSLIQIVIFAVIGIILYLKPDGLLGRGVDIGI